MKNALLIWRMILQKNKGLTYDFILGRLPRAEHEWFIHASTNFGCGGLAGGNYFMVDNSHLSSNRFSKKLGYRMLSVIELIKLRYNLKVSVSYIRSAANTSTDMLSRGKTPRWLKTRGTKHKVALGEIEKRLMDPITCWKKVLSV